MASRLPSANDINRGQSPTSTLSNVNAPSILSSPGGFSGLRGDPNFHPLMETPNVRGRTVPSSGAVGKALQGLGSDIIDVAAIQAKAADTIDNLRVEEAYNKLRDKQLDLTEGEGGYRKLKGTQIMSRKTSVLNEFPSAYDSASDEIIDSLSNDNQKALFKQRSNAGKINFRKDLLTHVMGEEERFKNDVSTGVMATEERSAMAEWFSPAALDKSKVRIRMVTEAALEGKPKEFIDATVNDSYERINSAVVFQAINNGDVGYAEQYIKNNSGQMDVSDVIKYSQQISKYRQDALIDTVVGKATNSLQQSYEPNEVDRLSALVLKAESGGKDYDSEGNILTSPKGARGRWQVMPETAKNPGYGIMPARDDSIGEYARVGQSYLIALLKDKDFEGDVSKSVAAYNAGPATVKDAIKKANEYNRGPTKARVAGGAKTWFNFLPEETQNYVNKIVTGYSKGINPIHPPTIIEVKADVERSMIGAPKEAIDRAKAKAIAAWHDLKGAADQKSEEALIDAKSRFDAGEIKSLDDLTPASKVAIAKHSSALESYIEAANKREEEITEMSPAATSQFYALMTEPSVLKDKSVPELMALSSDLGIDRVKKLMDKRAQFIEHPEAERAATIDADQFKAMANRFGVKDKTELLMLEDRAKEAITDTQNREGKALTREDKDKLLKRMFVEIPEVKVGERKGGFLRGIFGKDITQSVRGYEVKPGQEVIVPDDYKNQIKQSYAKAGADEPSEKEIRDIYVEWLALKELE